MKHEDDMNWGNINLNEDMIVAVVIANSPEKKIRDFIRIRTQGLCVSAAVNLQLRKLQLPQRSSYLQVNLYFRGSHHLCVYSTG